VFCPRCASEQSDDLKFCKSCGANLHAVRQAMTTRETDQTFDWSKTWVADMLLSPAERIKRAEELERQRGITPEVKRSNEIKAGVITGCVGAGVAILLYVLMQGIILSGKVAPGVDEILSRLWIAGIIPIFVGIALIINGLIVSKTRVEPGSKESQFDPHTPHTLKTGAAPDTSGLVQSGFSITEGTTRHLGNSDDSIKRD
jgi:hypothetical protein